LFFTGGAAGILPAETFTYLAASFGTKLLDTGGGVAFAGAAFFGNGIALLTGGTIVVVFYRAGGATFCGILALGETIGAVFFTGGGARVVLFLIAAGAIFCGATVF